MDFAIEMGLTACQQEMLTPPRHLTPPPAGPGVRVIHLCILLVTPTCVSRLITLWYLSHFTHHKKVKVVYYYMK
jgi:hypothetical protein